MISTCTPTRPPSTGQRFTDMEDYHRMWQAIQDSGRPMVLTVGWSDGWLVGRLEAWLSGRLVESHWAVGYYAPFAIIPNHNPNRDRYADPDPGGGQPTRAQHHTWRLRERQARWSRYFSILGLHDQLGGHRRWALAVRARNTRRKVWRLVE